MRSSTALVIGCVSLSVGCSGGGSVGADGCPAPGLQCESLSVGPQDEFPVPTTVASLVLEELPRLAPTWIRASSASASDQQLLLTDRERGLFLAAADVDGVRLSRLDDEGRVVESSAVVQPPLGVARGGEPPALVKYAFMYWENDRNPTLSVLWNPACKITDSCTAVHEQILFSSELAEAPVRFANIREVLRDEEGDFFMLSPTEETVTRSVVTKLDRTTRDVVWSQDHLTAGEDYRFVQGGVVLEHGRVALLMSDSTFDKHITVALDETGTPRRIGLERYDPRSSFVSFLASGGEPVVVYSTDSGLTVMRIRPDNTVDNAFFALQGSASPDLLGTADDGEGNIYFFTRTGDAQGIRPALCRATQDSADCVVLPAYLDAATEEELVVDDVVARRGGVVYVRSGSHLVRLDFPF